jgi:hypothetical protein
MPSDGFLAFRPMRTALPSTAPVRCRWAPQGTLNERAMALNYVQSAPIDSNDIITGYPVGYGSAQKPGQMKSGNS